jgi:broad specificity phosphatase PhoE
MTRRVRMAPWLIGVWVLSAIGAPVSAGAQPSLVVLVRHGEKQPTPVDDPSLSEAGVRRAAALDSALRDLVPSTIVVSTRKRTVETAAVVARRTGVTPTVITLDGGGASHVRAVAEAVQRARGVVLVVGHSNTVPAIVTALGGPKLPDLCDASYATLFLLTPARDGVAAQLVRAHYGLPDAMGADQCPGMVPR